MNETTAHAMERSRLRHLQAVTAQFAETQTIEQVRQIILGEVSHAIGADGGALSLVSGQMLIVSEQELGAQMRAAIRPYLSLRLDSQHPATDAVRTGEPLFINGPERIIQRYPDLAEKVVEYQTQAIAQMPLKRGAEVFGVLSLHFTEAHEWDAAERDFMVTLANRAAGSYERARLFEAEQQARLRAERLQILTARLARALTLADVVNAVLEEGLPVLGSNAGAVVQIVGDQLEIVGTAGYPPELSQIWQHFPLAANTPLSEAARTGVGVWVDGPNDYQQRYQQMPPPVALAISQAWVALPLIAYDQTLGALGISYPEPRAFDAESRRFAETLADLCAQALERSRLFETERATRQRLEATTALLAQALAAARMVAWEVVQGELTISDNTASLLGANTAQIQTIADGLANIHPDDLAQKRILFDQAVAQQTDFHSVYRFRNHDRATWLWLEDHARIRYLNGQPIAISGLTHDVTARKQIENDALLLTDLSELIRQSADQAHLLDTAVVRVGRYLELTNCLFAEIDHAHDTWVVAHEYCNGSISFVGTHQLATYPPTLVENSRKGQLIIASDTQRDPILAPYADQIFVPIHIRACVIVPLLREGRLVANFVATVATPHQWQPREIRLLETIAERIWLAVEKLRLEAAQRNYTSRLQQLNRAVLAINAAPTRDEVLQRTTTTARTLIGAHQAITSTSTDQYRTQAVSAVSLSETYPAWDDCRSVTLSNDLFALVCQSNTSMRLTHAELLAHPAWHPFGTDATQHPPMRGWLAAPLASSDGHNLGMIQLTERYTGDFTSNDEAMLVQLAQTASVALEKQALYEQEQVARTQAEEANRLKDEFLAMISHELRTPLTSILGYGQLLQSRERDPAYTARTVDKIVRSAIIQAQLIEDLLDASRVVSGKLTIERWPINLIPIIHAALDMVRPALDAKELQIVIDLPPTACTISGDTNRMQQVIWNLLSNAVKFTPPGGWITLQLQSLDGLAQITVRDSGQGISAEFLPHVFERFRQAEVTSTRTNMGLGLGLSIVQYIVELHGGTVQAQSEGIGHGATFTVMLPLASDLHPIRPTHDTATEQPSLNERLPDLHGLRVLVVEDQPDTIVFLEEALGSCGAIIHVHTSAQAALAELRAWQPDILLSDIATPLEDGYWLIQQVRALTAAAGGTTPAVALTAYARTEERTRVLGAGFNLYLSKPVDTGELQQAVASLTSAQNASAPQ